MTVIRAIASYVPPSFEINADKKEKFGIDDAFIAEKLGVGRVSRMMPGEDTSDMCVKAFRALQDRTGVSESDVDCVVVCTQNPDKHGIPHTSAIVHGKLGLREGCATFDISLGCSGYVYGLSVVISFMVANDLNCGLLFTADPYSKILDPEDKNTVLLFGDAASVTLLAPDDGSGPAWKPSGFRFLSRGRDGGALENGSGRLTMNGRAVFNFSATVVPGEVKAVLKDAGLTAADVDFFIFHQGSKYIMDTLKRRLDLPGEKVPLRLFDHGNTVSTSIPLILEDYCGRNEVRRMVLSGFGVGLSVASCLLEKLPSQ